MKKLCIILVALLVLGCKSKQENKATSVVEINETMDSWHKAAANADYNDYFELMADDAVFIGTDAAENWNKKEFMEFSKPFFDKGKAWNFTALERHVFFDKTGKTAWFDELLSTQMKICRGSGVLVKIGKEWKIKHYVLSMTIPNDASKEIIKLKTPIEDSIINTLKSKK